MSIKQAFGSPTCLPSTLAPFGVNREQAAELMGIGVTLFDALVEQGRAPQPRQIGKRNVFDVEELRRSFAQLPHRTDSRTLPELDNPALSSNPWDKSQ